MIFISIALKYVSFVSFSGCAFATESEWQWQAGKQYAFEYSGRLLTGIPQLASHYSGLGMTSTVLIDALTPTKLQLSVTNAKFASVNDRLEAKVNSPNGLDGANWREVILPAMIEVLFFQKLCPIFVGPTPIDSQITEISLKPINFFGKIKTNFVTPKVRNSITHLTLVSTPIDYGH